MKHGSIAMGLAGLALFSSSFTIQAANRTAEVSQIAVASPVTELSQVAAASRRFGFDLLRRCAPEAGENRIMSPASLYTVLAMTAAGAEKTTRDEMLSTLRIEGEDPMALPFGDWVSEMRGADAKVTFNLANSVWHQPSISLEKTYTKQVKTTFGAALYKAGRRMQTDVNRWVSRATKGFIREFPLPGGQADCLLLNAVYMKAAWQEAFNKNLTIEDVFHNASGTEAKAMFMRRKDHFSYGQTEVAEVLSIPYGNGAYRMTVLLPREGLGPNRILDWLTEETWASIQSFPSREVDLWLPRFQAETTLSDELVDALCGMGMTTAFTPDADFSRLSRTRLHISAVIQKARIEVNEEGTEAAAVSGVILMKSSMYVAPPVAFKVDRPFVYLISEENSGALLFAGVQNGF